MKNDKIVKSWDCTCRIEYSPCGTNTFLNHFFISGEEVAECKECEATWLIADMTEFMYEV